MKKISIIVPVHNTEKFIDKSLHSLINQKHSNIEILLINNNSTAECTEYLEEISKKDDRIILLNYNYKLSVGASRNYGIENATGEFIYFFDSDDYLPENTLEILVNNIKHHNIIRGKFKHTNFATGVTIVLEGLFNVKMYSEKKFKLLNNKSALNYLIRKDFIQSYQLRFSEEVSVYSDLAFILPAIVNVAQIPFAKDAIYFKRKRNDPLSNPALSQINHAERVENFLYIYNRLREIYYNHEAGTFLDKQLLNYYRRSIIILFKDEKEINSIYSQLVLAFKKIPKDFINKQDKILRKDIKTALKGKNKFTKVIARHQLLRDIREGFKTQRKFYLLIYRKIFNKLKIENNMVFFESFLGKSYSDSPKYIYEYMLENNVNYKFIWCFREKKKNIPGNPVQVKRFSLRYYYYLAKSKYWVSNIRLPKSLGKRDENIYLQTWHGTPLKTLVFDQEDIYSADPNYKKNFFEQSRRWDYLISPNQYSSDIFKRAFKYDKQLLEYGYPRNDILYNKNNIKQINTIKKQLGLPPEKKVILYAPTWRDDEFYSRGNYKFTLQMDFKEMKNNLSDEYVLLLRTHYHIANQMDITGYEDFVYDFSYHDDIAELYLVSDILITDYSSVFFDYAHLQRPILFYTYDLEKYRDTLRGFYFEMESEVPGPLLMNTKEVVNAIKNIENINEKYKDRYSYFYDKYCLWDEGLAAKKVVEKVFNN